MFDQVVQAMFQQRAEWIVAQLDTMATGETLCLHEDRGDFEHVSDQMTVRARAHVLAVGGVCDSPTSRTQYGPKP